MSLSLNSRALRYLMATAITLTLATTISAPFQLHAATGAVKCGGTGTDKDTFGCNDLAAGTGLTAKDPKALILALINVAMGFLGLVAVVIILYGGFKWMTAAGNEEKVEEAKKLIGAGIIGLVIILTAYSLVTYVIQTVLKAQTS